MLGIFKQRSHGSETSPPPEKVVVPFWKRKKVIISAAIITMLIIVAVILIAVLVPRSHSHSDGSSGGSSNSTAHNKPNVLVIMTDDQDQLLDSLSAQPKIMSRIAGQGINFQKHYCTVAWCCPSRVNFLTGLTAHNTNVTALAPPQGGYGKFVDNGFNDKWLPIWMQEQNIDTYYVGKLMNGFGKSEFAQTKPKGWTHSQFLVDPFTYEYHHSRWTNDLDDGISDPNTTHTTIVTQDKALAMLDQAAAAKNQFFMMVAPVAPHVQGGAGNSYIPPAPPGTENMFLDRAPNVSANFNPENPSGASWLLQLPRRSDDDVNGANGMVDLYQHRLQNLAGIDNMVDTILDKLDDLGLTDNTYVIYTTDNGFHIGNHRLAPGKKCGYEEDINIPLLIRGPNVPQGKTSSNFQSHTDMAPTILQMLGVPLQSSFDGQPIPYTSVSDVTGTELVNVEFWEPHTANANDKRTLHPIRALTYSELDWKRNQNTMDFVSFDEEGDIEMLSERYNNTYKSLRIQTASESFYYSVWCDGSHELYDMNTDIVQMNNLMAPSTAGNTSQAASNMRFFGRSIDQLVNRLDTLLYVMKDCSGDVCRNPWGAIFPNARNMNGLDTVMAASYDSYFSSQPQVTFDQCLGSYVPSNENTAPYKPFTKKAKARAKRHDGLIGGR